MLAVQLEIEGEYPDLLVTRTESHCIRGIQWQDYRYMPVIVPITGACLTVDGMHHKFSRYTMSIWSSDDGT